MQNKIILGHPFSGSLYMFFEQQLSSTPFKEPIGHPYYRDLFGHTYDYWKDLAFTLFAIFDEIIIPPADARVPDYQKYSSNGIYHNTDLGIFFNWDDFFDGEIREKVRRDLEDPLIQKALEMYSPEEKKGILEYVNLYIRLSRKYDCPVLCGGTYQEVFSYLVEKSQLNNGNSSKPGADSVAFTQNYLKLSLASFTISSLDTLYELKSDKEIRTYGQSFRKIMSQNQDISNSETEIKELLKRSLSKDCFYRKVASCLNTASVVFSVGGFIPGIGPLFSALGLAGTLASSELQKNKYNWYQLVYSIDKVDKHVAIKLL